LDRRYLLGRLEPGLVYRSGQAATMSTKSFD